MYPRGSTIKPDPEGLAFLPVIAPAQIGILAEEAIEEILETALTLTVALTLAVAVALRTLILIVAVIAVGRLLLLRERLDEAATPVLLLLFGQDFGVDVHNGRTDFFRDARKVGRELTSGGNLERRGIGAVDL